ncbi:MAG: repressor LexA [Candidatus Taylorbacteria bacterium RIFCSPHIGHO2_01_FULL_46_22b]|uniref:Repressor LexA n=1 Tax=Candidatus Taylorbacteria bacterium RIFCSPHIGHO2_01_FULL_46_22b TaxID=1802301 RepID=A0A1G2M2S3_9BACT|nr:MAG: repressor LexA [Candidatus Taylorbacteria bacterium RIFCSPHIGHO2_01_FULL_46_22b]
MYNEYQDKIVSFFKQYKRLPSYREVMKLVGFKSKNSVHKLMSKLVEAGILTRDSNGKYAPSNIFGEVAVLGLVKAGLPAPAEESVQDTMSLDDYLIEGTGSSYLLEVDGDSMIDAHIAEGDMVLVERTNKAKDGEIVIAEVDGDFTMKYFRQSGNKVWLEPANKNYKPIYPTESLNITAKVKAVIRKF